jgi:hypothetical protein
MPFFFEAVGLDAFVLAPSKLTFSRAGLVNKPAAQPISRGATLAETELDQTALAREDLDREFPAVFAGHRALNALDDGGDRTSVILELLGAILHADASALADIFVVSALVRILKPAPAADVVDEDGRKIGHSMLDVFDQLLQPIASI